MLAFLSKAGRGESKHKKHLKPRTVNQALGRELVITHDVDPDLAWSLMQVATPMPEHDHRYQVRIYSSKQAAGKGVAIKDYHSLDNQLHLVLYHGWFDSKNNDAKLAAGPDQLVKAS